MQQGHSFRTFLAPRKRRRKHSTVKDLAQVLTGYPALSLVQSYYAVEIGASPTFEAPQRDGWQPSLPSSRKEKEVRGDI